MMRQLLDRLRGVHRLSDPVFGSLSRRGANGILQGTAHFPPTNERVELLIDSSVGVPTTSQQQYWLELQRRYADLVPLIGPSLAEDPSTAAQYQLVVIDLQSDDPYRGDVELTYELGGDIRSFVVRGWQPSEVVPEWAGPASSRLTLACRGRAAVHDFSQAEDAAKRPHAPESDR